MKNKIKFKLKIVLVISYMIFIYFFSEYRFSKKPMGIDPPPFNFLFSFLHICEFGLLSILLMYAFYDKINIGILLSISISYGIFDEFHQYFIPYRWFDYTDILCNFIGAILGILGFLVLMLIYDYFFVIKNWNKFFRKGV